MTTLICFGFGYCAEHFIAAYGKKFGRVIGTVRGRERAAILNAYEGGRVRALTFDGTSREPELDRAIAEADAVLVSVPPGDNGSGDNSSGDNGPSDNGDPLLSVYGPLLSQAKNLRAIVYLSTIGVYGDRGGEWVDETAEAQPDSGRGSARLKAERAWRSLGEGCGASAAVLRLAGIYGPGQNALEQIARGKARRVIKPGQIFNRIHVVDIAQAIDAAFTRRASGIFNIADDEPSPPADPLVFAAQLLGVTPPPEIPFAQAALTMSPMALSFWQECRRVKNGKLKRELGVVLRYPTYREGLRALFAAK
jgi:nucleoside-diphosphate-sugar epimerase